MLTRRQTGTLRRATGGQTAPAVGATGDAAGGAAPNVEDVDGANEEAGRAAPTVRATGGEAAPSVGATGGATGLAGSDGTAPFGTAGIGVGVPPSNTGGVTGNHPVFWGPNPFGGTIPNVQGFHPFAPYPFVNPYAFTGNANGNPGGMGTPGDSTTVVNGPDGAMGVKTFDDLLTLIGCSPACITIIKNTKINSLNHVLSWSGNEIDKMIKTFRKSGIEILPNVEKNIHLMVGEAQIRHQTHQPLESMYYSKTDDFTK